MSVSKRKGSPFYWYDFTLEIDGQNRRFRGSTQTASRSDAETIEAIERRKTLMAAHLGERKEWTLDQACGSYWEEHAKFLPTAVNIERDILHLERLLGETVLLSKINGSRIMRDLVARRRAEVAVSPNARYGSNRTVNTATETLRAIVRRASNIHDVHIAKVDWGALLLEEADQRDRYLSIDECRRLLHAAADHLKPIIEFALLTGLRKGNILSMDWSQIDMQAGLITLKVKSKKQGGKTHSIPIAEPLFVLLANLGPRERGPVFTYTPPHPGRRRIEEAQAALAEHDGNYSAASRSLGITDNGLRKRLAAAKKIPAPRPVKSVDRAWRAALRRARIEDFRFHDLRHTCASWMVQNGVPLEVVQKILGHSDIRTTMRYAHHAPGAMSSGLATLSTQLRHMDGSREAQCIERKNRISSG